MKLFKGYLKENSKGNTGGENNHQSCEFIGEHVCFHHSVKLNYSQIIKLAFFQLSRFEYVVDKRISEILALPCFII